MCQRACRLRCHVQARMSVKLVSLRCRETFDGFNNSTGSTETGKGRPLTLQQTLVNEQTTRKNQRSKTQTKIMHLN